MNRPVLTDHYTEYCLSERGLQRYAIEYVPGDYSMEFIVDNIGGLEKDFMFSGQIKSDGCMDLNFADCIHLCDSQDDRELASLLKSIRELASICVLHWNCEESK